MKTEYLLDTNALVWLLSGDDRLAGHIREDIETFGHQYRVSEASILEYIQLQQLGKVKRLPYGDLEKWMRVFNIIPEALIWENASRLQRLPVLTIDGKRHTDPFDRIIIATAIEHRYTVISADRKFPDYRKLGLQLVEL